MLISFVVPTFCEELSLRRHYYECTLAIQAVKEQYDKIIEYEYLVIDNCSHDNTVNVALGLRENDNRVKIFVNDRNYGPVLSPFEGMLNARGDVILLIAADLQEPPEILPLLLEGIFEGCDAAIAYKADSVESTVMWVVRGAYYRLLSGLGLYVLPYRYSGFGLYTRELVERIKNDTSEEPSMRILIAKYAKKIASVGYKHHERTAGASSYSLYGYTREALKNIARNGSSFPNIAGKIAIATAVFSIALIPIAILVKISFWKSLAPGVTTLLIAYLMWNSVLMGFIALILDQQAIIIRRLQPPTNRVKHSKVYK
jgi:glycosyltransferase involved in cell wall biosynthesis